MECVPKKEMASKHAQQPGVVEEMATAIADQVSRRVVPTGIVYRSNQVSIKNAVVDGIHGVVVETGVLNEARDVEYDGGVFFHNAQDASVAFVSTLRTLGHKVNVPVHITSTTVVACVLNLDFNGMEESQEKVQRLLSAPVHLVD